MLDTVTVSDSGSQTNHPVSMFCTAKYRMSLFVRSCSPGPVAPFSVTSNVATPSVEPVERTISAPPVSIDPTDVIPVKAMSATGSTPVYASWR